MFPRSGSWCHRCSLNSTSLYFEENEGWGRDHRFMLAGSPVLSRCIILFNVKYVPHLRSQVASVLRKLKKLPLLSFCYLLQTPLFKAPVNYSSTIKLHLSHFNSAHLLIFYTCAKDQVSVFSNLWTIHLGKQLMQQLVHF